MLTISGKMYLNKYIHQFMKERNHLNASFVKKNLMQNLIISGKMYLNKNISSVQEGKAPFECIICHDNFTAKVNYQW